MNADGIGRALKRMAHEILERARGGELAIVGIRRGGVHLAERLRQELAKTTGQQPLLGTLDITLYRDDLSELASAPVVGPTDIRFPVTGKTVVLVDDVIYTGRTVRAAMNELFDYGRPRSIALVVLADRGGRQLPIAAQHAGAVVQVPADKRLRLNRADDGRLSLELADGG